MDKDIHFSGVKEDFHKAFTSILQKEAKKLEDVFNEVTFFIKVSSSLDPSLNVKLYWAGSFNLMEFIENLPKLKNRVPQVYTFMLDEYGDIINKGKRLIAELKLQELPIPNVQVIYNNSVPHYKAEMKYSVYTPSEEAAWMCEKYSNKADSEFQLNRHLKTDILILVDICEVLTRTFYVYLTTILKSVAKERV